MRPRIAVIADSPDENWPSMDLVAEMLVREWRGELASEVDAERLEWDLPHVTRRMTSDRRAFTIDRVLGRFVRYPAHAAMARRGFDFFHVADHTYAHVVHALPRARTGVYCHDMDAFRCLLEPEREPRGAAFRAMTQTVLAGMRRASFVFHSTREMGRRLERVVAKERLVYAPYGLSDDYRAELDPNDGADAVLAPLGGAPFVLHVGSAIARKRLDVLFDVFAKLHAKMPALRLVQQGGALTEDHRTQLRRLGIEHLLLQPPKLERRTLAGLYRRAAVVIFPSEAEGFGLPVLEALACGAPVVASDIPTTREAGGGVTPYVRVADVDGFVEVATRLLASRSDVGARERRVAHARTFSWRRHAETILSAYKSLDRRSSS